MRAPRIAVGYEGEIKSALHVNSQDSKDTALFTGAAEVGVEIRSPALGAALRLASGDVLWEAKAKGDELSVGKQGRGATLRMADGKVGINTAAAPSQALHIQTSRKGDTVLFQGNYDGKAETLTDALLTLESSKDHRGRGIFLTHRDRSEGAKAHAWFAGVPAEGSGFSIGNSATHVAEALDGPYSKSSSRMFITPDGSVGFGSTKPEGRVDIVVPDGSKQAPQALNIKGGSISLDFKHSLNIGGVAAVTGDKKALSLGSAKSARDIRLVAGNKETAVVVQKETGWLGVGGVDKPLSALDVKGKMTMQEGSINIDGQPKDAEQMLVLNSKATVPATIGLKQAGKEYMAVSAGEDGGRKI